jgi:hypothetical protein
MRVERQKDFNGDHLEVGKISKYWIAINYIRMKIERSTFFWR